MAKFGSPEQLYFTSVYNLWEGLNCRLNTVSDLCISYMRFNYSDVYYKLTGAPASFAHKLGLNLAPSNKMLYFVRAKYIFKYMNYGCTLCTVRIPEDTVVTKTGWMYECNKMIITSMEDLNLQNITMLVNEGANIHLGEFEPVHWAARTGAADIVRYLIGFGVIDGEALELACKYGHDEAARLLVDAGADDLVATQ